jgi:hypothetical protein
MTNKTHPSQPFCLEISFEKGRMTHFRLVIGARSIRIILVMLAMVATIAQDQQVMDLISP